MAFLTIGKKLRRDGVESGGDLSSSNTIRNIFNEKKGGGQWQGEGIRLHLRLEPTGERKRRGDANSSKEKKGEDILSVKGEVHLMGGNDLKSFFQRKGISGGRGGGKPVRSTRWLEEGNVHLQK